MWDPLVIMLFKYTNLILILLKGIVPSLTGGQIYYLPRFDAVRDRIVFRSHLQRLMRRMVGYNCTARVRTSKGRLTLHASESY